VDTHINLRLAKVFLNRQNEILENKVGQRTREILLTRDITVQSMMSLLEVRDIESGQHIKRTQLYTKEICSYLSEHGPYHDMMTKDRIENIYRTAPLHDIGKVGIPDKILLKPGKLTYEEFEIMKKHTTYAIKAFSSIDESLGDTNFLNVAKEIAGSHHERFDGTILMAYQVKIYHLQAE
jgi:putative two-component system response regulator